MASWPLRHLPRFLLSLLPPPGVLCDHPPLPSRLQSSGHGQAAVTSFDEVKQVLWPWITANSQEVPSPIWALHSEATDCTYDHTSSARANEARRIHMNRLCLRRWHMLSHSRRFAMGCWRVGDFDHPGLVTLGPRNVWLEVWCVSV